MSGREIDMEILRRLARVSDLLEDEVPEDPEGIHELLEACDALEDRLRRLGELAMEAPRTLARHLRAELQETASVGADLAPAWAAVAAALEDHVVDPDDSAARSVLKERVETLRRELPAPEAGPDPVSPELREEGWNAVAALVVELDPECHEDLARLARALETARDESGVPEGAASSLETVIEELRRVSEHRRSRKKARRAAVRTASDLVETILVAAEEAGLKDEPPPPPGDSTVHETEGRDASPTGAGSPEGRGDPEAPAADEDGDEEGWGGEARIPEDADPELVRDFAAESLEHLDQAEAALLALEEEPEDEGAVNVIFRAFHTIKGVSSFLELDQVSDLAHHAETLFSQVRDRELVFSSGVADLALRSCDTLRELIGRVSENIDERVYSTPRAYEPLLEVLADPELGTRIEEDDLPDLDGIAAGAEEGSGPGADGVLSGTTDDSVRVRTARLDRLVDLVGELVVAHSMIAEDPHLRNERGSLSKKVNRSEKILRELQDLSTSLRMVPLKPAFHKVSRVVRDASRKAGKKVHLVTSGEDTELDRSMVNVLADPLVHMVRNSIDHGIEPPEERRARGKPETGTIELAAFQAGGSVVVEIRDDGGGLDREQILTKARQNGIIDPDRSPSDDEVYELIFAPGFSTAARVTDISGRGVGMDVVRRSVESLRGRIDIDSEPGEGTTFSIRLPLTLAIIDGMLVRVGQERYIVPMVKIRMSFRPEPEDLSTISGKGEMVTLHDELLPVARLHRLYGIDHAETDPTRGLLMVVGEGSRGCALMVDELLGQQQFVVKPLEGAAAAVPGIAGGAVMGDGAVGLILDPEDLVELARQVPVDGSGMRSVA